jgi:hypothetical protein
VVRRTARPVRGELCVVIIIELVTRLVRSVRLPESRGAALRARRDELGWTGAPAYFAVGLVAGWGGRQDGKRLFSAAPTYLWSRSVGPTPRPLALVIQSGLPGDVAFLDVGKVACSGFEIMIVVQDHQAVMGCSSTDKQIDS